MWADDKSFWVDMKQRDLGWIPCTALESIHGVVVVDIDRMVDGEASLSFVADKDPHMQETHSQHALEDKSPAYPCYADA